MRTRLPAVLDHLDGQAVAGGCDSCSAEQHFERVRGTRITKVTIRHDDGCPVLARATRR